MPARTDNPLLAAALSYIARGWRVVPLDRPTPGDHRSGKRPAVLDWPRLRWSETDAAAHWSQPDAGNVGILTGSVSGLAVLDFDGEAAGAAWREAHADVLTYRVGRPNAPEGRFHAYFSLLAGEAAPRSTSGDGWDLLSTGRLVVAPPSVHHSGSVYTVLCDVPPAPWKLEFLPSGETEPEREPGAPAPGPKAPADRIRDALAAIPADTAYPEWIKVGQAVHAWDPERGLPLWQEWSATGSKHRDGEPAAKWATFSTDPAGVGIGTLFTIAKAHGWRPRGRALPEGGYGPLPRRLVESGLIADMDRGELAVLCCVAVTMNTGAGCCRLKAETLAQKCGASDATVRRAVAALRDKGVLLVTPTGRASVFRWGVSL